MKIGFVGLGNMGTAMANLVADNGYEVIGWEFDKNTVEEINSKNINSKFLPGIRLNPNLKATKELREVFDNCEIIFIAIPSRFIKNTLQPLKDKIAENIMLVNLAKGIDNNTGLTSFQTISLLFPQNRKIMLSGPSIAYEFARKIPTVVMLAGKNRSDISTVSHILDNEFFRTRFSKDEIGVELGGILKNIYAIGLGILDGKNRKGVNFRAGYLTIALDEMKKIGKSFKAKEKTFYSLSGMGDLLATSLSEHSHNRKMGELLAKGLNLKEIKNKMGFLSEGYYTLRALFATRKFHISAPIGEENSSLLDASPRLHLARIGEEDKSSSLLLANAPIAESLWNVINGRYKIEEFVEFYKKIQKEHCRTH